MTLLSHETGRIIRFADYPKDLNATSCRRHYLRLSSVAYFHRRYDRTNTIQPQTGGKVNDEIPNLAPHGEMVTTQWRGGADVQLVRDPLAVSSMSRRHFLAFSPTRLGQPCLSASTARLKSSLAFPQSRFTPLPS